LTDKGEIVRLFWPDIDYPQHIEELNVGIFFFGEKYSTVWLKDDRWEAKQYYIDHTNILKTVYTLYINDNIKLEISQTDFVPPHKNILIRHYEIKNKSFKDVDLGFMAYSAFTSNNQDVRGTLFDFSSEALVHYRHNCYISLSADREVFQFQLGDNALEAAKSSELYGINSIGMMHDGALSWKIGELPEGNKTTFTLFICMAETLSELKTLTLEARKSGWQEYYFLTEKYWTDFFSSKREISIQPDEAVELYKKSLMVFKLMQNQRTGGLLAAPEADEHFTRCGRYGYCWGRDAAFITGAMDRCGMTEEVDKFFEWALKAQDPDGFWHQRYFTDGNLAPSWGIQIDETGTLIWGMLEHYKVTKNIDFLKRVWPCVKKAVEFLISFTDSETGLPGLSYDLWEERLGQHLYSSAAVYGGIMAGAEIAKIMGLPGEFAAEWEERANRIKKAIEKIFWDESCGRFIRSVRVKLNPWGNEHSTDTSLVKVNPKNYYAEVTLKDYTVDVSLLGICIPFGLMDINDARVEATVYAIENALKYETKGDVVSGLGRYENDGYIGGNPWIVATLWIALYHIKKKNYSKAWEYLNWAVNARTNLGFLPEQVDKYTGKPAWIIPLTWSHAMFVLVLLELIDEGVFYGEGENSLYLPGMRL